MRLHRIKRKEHSVTDLNFKSAVKPTPVPSPEGIRAELLDSVGEVISAGLARLGEGDQWVFEPTAEASLESLVESARKLHIEKYPILEIRNLCTCVHDHRHLHFRF